MKKYLLTLLVCFSAYIQSFAYTSYTDENNVIWQVTLNTTSKEATIERGTSNNPKDLVIPDKMTIGDVEYTVTQIGYYAFAAREDIETIELPSTITCISYGGYTTINGVYTSYGVFSHNASLKSVDFNGAQCNIESYAFRDCSSLTSVGDLLACTSIGNGAFYGCSSLTSIDLSACTSIAGEAFRGCSSLTSVDLSACTSIGYYAFGSCSSLTSVGDLSACTAIEYGAFENCSSLTSIDLSACTSIGAYAFRDCSSLTSVGDLSKCTSIGNDAFYNCSSLTSIDLSACTSIGGGAFQYCSSLTSVGDLSACTSIGGYAFYLCSSLNKIVLSATTMATATGSNPTSECTTVLVPEVLLDAYRSSTNWSDMANRILPIGIKTDYDIEVTASDNSSAIQTAIGMNNLANVMSLKVKGSINGYDIIVLRNKMLNLHNLDLSGANIVEDADNYPYYQNYYTTTGVFPSYAFYEMRKLSHIELPTSINSIGGYALQSCSNLIEITIPEGVTSINGSAFTYCDNLKSVTIPSTVTVIGGSAFQGCGSLQAIELPSSITRIGSHAFSSCSKLNTVTIPSSVKSIGESAFNYCTNLQSVYATSVLPISIGQNTFSNWTTATLYVPQSDDWDATFNAYYWDTQWSQFATIKGWKPTYDYFYVDGEYEMESGEIPGTGEKNPDADFGKESGFIVDEGAEQGMGEVNVDSDGESGGSIIAQGGTESSDEGNVTAEKLNIKIQVNSGRWYFFSFPYDIPKTSVTCDANYVFRHYDGNGRANGNSGWKNVTSTDGEYLKAGKGYIFQCDKSTDLILTVDNPKFNGKDKKTGLDEAKGESTNAQNANWNFVGNPFLSYFNMEDIDYNCPITVWNGSSYEAIRPGDDDYSFHPFQAFFVQKPEGMADIGFDAKGRETKTQSEKKQKEAKARRMMRKAAVNRQLINLEISDGQNVDKTRVVFNQAKADAYEMDCDAAKFMSTEAVPQIYTLDSKGVKYAINERPDGNVRIGYEAKKAGLFTISAMRMEKAVSLLDKQTGELVSLEEPFTFSSKAGTFNDRFELVIGSPTDIRSVDSDKQGASTSDSFTLGGIRTNAGEKGIIISDGKKHLNK